MYLLKLIYRNTFRHKLRTALTILGVTIAILTFSILRTLVSAWYAGAEAASPVRLITRNSISLNFPLPIAYKERISRISEVKNVSYATWFSGIYITEKNFIPNFAIDPETFLDLYPEYLLPKDQKNAFIRDRTAAIAGRRVAERFNWKVGDTIPLIGTIYPGTWNFTLRGIYDGAEQGTDDTQLFFHWDYLNERLKRTAPHQADRVGIYIVGITNPDLASEVAEAIDNTFRHSLAETMTETEKSFQLGFIAMTEAIVVVIQLISFMVIIIIMAVVANTMVMTERERIGEYAIMKALGFGGRHLSTLIFGESLFITLAGCIFGIALAFPAAGIFREQIGMYFPVFNISTHIILIDIAISVIVAMAAAIFPTGSAIQIRVAEGLRRIG
jgi:putative ABC transport system permease protein